MNLLELEKDGKTYTFRMTYKAKLEIDKLSMDNLSKMDSPELAKAYSVYSKMNKEGLTEDEKSEMMIQIMPYIGQLSKLNSSVDSVDLGFILLKNSKETSTITREEYDDLYEFTEKEKGFEETIKLFNDMHDKVFTLVEKMNTPTKTVATKEETKKLN